jgi:hypothetical protein
VTFIYEKNTERLLQHISGTDENEVVRQSLEWCEKNSLTIAREALKRPLGASESERSTELQDGSATQEVDSMIKRFYTARCLTRRTKCFRRDPRKAVLAIATVIGWMKPANWGSIGERGLAKIRAAAGWVPRELVSTARVNPSINFPVLIFLSLFALIFLLNGSAILSRLSQPTFESEKTADPTAVRRASLAGSDVTTTFSDAVQIKGQADDRLVDPSLNFAPDKTTPKPDAAPTRPGKRIQSPVSVESVFRPRITTNPATRIHSRSSSSYRLGLTNKIGAFVLYRQSTSGTGLSDHKDAFATRANRRSSKKIRNDIGRFERRLVRLFRSIWPRPSSNH